MTARPIQRDLISALGVISNTVENTSLSSSGRKEQSLLHNFSGNIGTVRSTRYTDVPRSRASLSTMLPGVT